MKIQVTEPVEVADNPVSQAPLDQNDPKYSAQQSALSWRRNSLPL